MYELNPGRPIQFDGLIGRLSKEEFEHRSMVACELVDLYLGYADELLESGKYKTMRRLLANIKLIRCYLPEQLNQYLDEHERSFFRFIEVDERQKMYRMAK